MTTNSRRLDEMKKLEKRIDAWTYVANLARKIIRFADRKRGIYTYERNIIANELTNEMRRMDIVLEKRKEHNRRNFRIETDL